MKIWNTWNNAQKKCAPYYARAKKNGYPGSFQNYAKEWYENPPAAEQLMWP